MKVLFVNTLYPPLSLGGAERSVQLLSEELVRRGHEVVVVSTAPHGAAGAGIRHGVRCRTVPLANVYWPFGRRRAGALRALFHAVDTYNPWMARRLGHILDEERPEIAHTNNLYGFSVSAWAEVRRRRIPLVHTIRDYYLMCRRASMFRGGRNCLRRCAACAFQAEPRRLLSDSVDAVVGVSAFILQRHLDAGYFANTPSKTAIFNICGDPDAARPALATDAALRLGYLGRLQPEKGVELLLSAVRTLPRVTVCIAGAGDPEYVAALQARYASDRVRFAGFITPRALLEQIDALVVPSLWHEPMGRGVVESYSFGVPVIAAARGGIVELVQEGKTGWLFDPDSPKGLTDVISSLVDDRHRVTGLRQCCLEAASAFRADRIAAAYERVYTAVLAGTRR